jgi:hypothetical protein
MTRAKEAGGLGFRDLHIFNLAMKLSAMLENFTKPNLIVCRSPESKIFSIGGYVLYLA